jgi:hypothetical protein
LHIVALPGRDPQTEAWMRDLIGALALSKATVRALHYRHWDTGAQPSFDAEAATIAGLAPDLAVAKSMGTLVSVAAFGAYAFRPERAVFIGTPFNHFGGYAPAMRDFCRAVPTLFIQQTADVTTRFDELTRALGDIDGAIFAEVPGSDHVYSDVKALACLVRDWLGAQAKP